MWMLLQNLFSDSGESETSGTTGEKKYVIIFSGQTRPTERKGCYH